MMTVTPVRYYEHTDLSQWRVHQRRADLSWLQNSNSTVSSLRQPQTPEQITFVSKFKTQVHFAPLTTLLYKSNNTLRSPYWYTTFTGRDMNAENLVAVLFPVPGSPKSSAWPLILRRILKTRVTCFTKKSNKTFGVFSPLNLDSNIGTICSKGFVAAKTSSYST